MAVTAGDEVYLRGDSNRDGSVRLLYGADGDGDGIPDATQQHRVNGRWVEMSASPAALAAGLATATGKAAAYARHRELGFVSLADPVFGGLSASDAAHNTAVVQSSVSALALIGGGNIVIPHPGFDIPINSMVVDNTWSNIGITGWGKPVLHTATGRATFDYGGTEEYVATGAQLTGIAPAGTKVVALLSGSDPLKPAAGAMVVIISGDKAAVVSTSSVPYGEWNEVLSVSGASVTLKYPLRQTYRPAANTATDYRIITIANRPKRFSLAGLKLVHDVNTPYEVHGMFLKARDCELEGYAGLCIRGRFLDTEYDCRIPTSHWFDGSGGRRPMIYAIDTTGSDFRVRATADVGGHPIVHVHEGVCFGEVEVTVTGAETEPDANATSWGVGSIDAGNHDVKFRYNIRNAAKSYFVNVAGHSWLRPGPERVSIELTAAGKVVSGGFVLRSTEGSAAPGFPIDCKLDLAGAQAATPHFSDAAQTYARNLHAVPISRTQFLASGAGVLEAGLDGENVVRLPDGASSGIVSWQLDQPSWATNRKRVRLVVEMYPTTDGDGTTGASQTRVDIGFGQNTTGNAIASFGTAVSTFPVFYKAGSFVYASASFDVVSTNGRCGIQVTRIPTAGADVFAGDIVVRRLWMVFYDPITA